jgi:hypothetical protein
MEFYVHVVWCFRPERYDSVFCLSKIFEVVNFIILRHICFS